MYKLITNETGQLDCIHNTENNKWIPLDPANTDYQNYLTWLEEGNTPLPAEGNTVIDNGGGE